MSDTNFSDASATSSGTPIISAWLNAVNKWLFWGRKPGYATTTGSANAQVVTLEAGSLYTAGSEADGDEFWFKAGFTNTGAMTLQVLPPSGTNIAQAVQFEGAALTGGEVQAGVVYKAKRLGTTWQLSRSSQLKIAGLTAQRTLTLPNADFTIAGPTAARTLTLPDANLTFPAVAQKGDVLVTTGAGVLAAVSVGTDGQTLTADSTQPSGVSYQSTGFSTGDVKLTIKTVADTGWVMMNDGSIGNAASGASTRANADTQSLYSLLWTNVIDAWAPVSGGRGATAAADFAANKPIFLPKVLGRALAVAGTGLLAQSVAAASVDTTGDQIAVADASSYYTGTPVVFTTSGGAPAPLVAATTYFAIYVDATHIQLATTLANAQNGTAINLTTQGTGIHTFTINFSARVLGQILGEENHAMSIAELLAHTHAIRKDQNNILNGGGAGLQISPSNSGTSGSAGGNAAMNNMQPAVFLNVMLKL